MYRNLLKLSRAAVITAVELTFSFVSENKNGWLFAGPKGSRIKTYNLFYLMHTVVHIEKQLCNQTSLMLQFFRMFI